MNQISKEIIECFDGGGKLLICGNGGSASMSNHFAAELVCSFENKKRRPLPAISLCANQSILTAWSNDFSFKGVFSRQLEALGNPGDLLITLSTSGASQNVIDAEFKAHDMCIEVIDFPRKGKGTAQIQEYQLRLMHKICREVEKAMFP